jgi:hypothetical protein
MPQLSPPAHIFRRTSAGRRNGNQRREEGACALRHGQGGQGHRAGPGLWHHMLGQPGWRRAREARCQAHCRQLRREQGKIIIDAAAGQDHHRRSPGQRRPILVILLAGTQVLTATATPLDCGQRSSHAALPKAACFGAKWSTSPTARLFDLPRVHCLHLRARHRGHDEAPPQIAALHAQRQGGGVLARFWAGTRNPPACCLLLKFEQRH